MEVKLIKIKVHNCIIYIGRESLVRLPGCVSEQSKTEQIVVVADQAVADLHLRRLLSCLPSSPLVVTFPPGEESKSLETVRQVYDRLAKARVARDAVVVSFGGGVACDIGGFVAATWHRGVRSVLVPTTLLAAVDASVGGKTGVNLPAGKNLVGAFHQPAAVIIDTHFLQTLPDNEFTSGLAESAKHAVVRDPEFLMWHELHADAILRHDPGVVEALIARNCALKAEIVGLDEREAGLRAILNHGHTIGHALEHLLDYTWRHGECVALGMVAENALACARGMLPRPTAARIRTLLERLGLPLRLPRAVDAAAVAAVCRVDKKVRGGRVNFVLLRDIGRPERVADVSDEELRGALEAIQPT